jgi:deazaflavin-dependent oxidoreductase (nitroreductase family)
VAVKDFVNTLQRTSEIQLTVVGRKSRRRISFTAWFALEDSTLYLLPVNGSDMQWYKNVLKNPSIEVRAGRQRVSVKARPITDRRRVRKVVGLFRENYGAGDVKRYYTKFDVAVELPLSRARAVAPRRRSATAG